MNKNYPFILTGYTGAIGSVILEKLLIKTDASLILIGRGFNESAYAEYSHRIVFVKSQLDDIKALRSNVQDFARDAGPVGGFVHCAGTIINGLCGKLDYESEVATFDVNYFSCQVIVTAFLQNFIKARSSRIITLSSSSVRDLPVGRSTYSASKAALEAYTCTLGREYIRLGICANAVRLGPISTPMMSNHTSISLSDQIRYRMPNKKFGTPGEIAEIVIQILRMETTFLNSSVISIDGGLIGV
jgi:NAD(P)-dependent dehydrogenase (short-subunit alcohol dehydrogenase family)